MRHETQAGSVKFNFITAILYMIVIFLVRYLAFGSSVDASLCRCVVGEREIYHSSLETIFVLNPNNNILYVLVFACVAIV